MFSKLVSQASQFAMEGVKNLVVKKHVSCILSTAVLRIRQIVCSFLVDLVIKRTKLVTLMIKSKDMFLYSAVSSPLDHSKRFTPWQTRSFRHQLDFSGKHSSHAATSKHSHFLQVLSIARCSFIQLSEQGCQWRE